VKSPTGESGSGTRPLAWGPDETVFLNGNAPDDMRQSLSLPVRYQRFIEAVFMQDPESYQPLFVNWSTR